MGKNFQSRENVRAFQKEEKGDIKMQKNDRERHAHGISEILVYLYTVAEEENVGLDGKETC